MVRRLVEKRGKERNFKEDGDWYCKVGKERRLFGGDRGRKIFGFWGGMGVKWGILGKIEMRGRVGYDGEGGCIDSDKLIKSWSFREEMEVSRLKRIHKDRLKGLIKAHWKK